MKKRGLFSKPKKSPKSVFIFLLILVVLVTFLVTFLFNKKTSMIVSNPIRTEKEFTKTGLNKDLCEPLSLDKLAELLPSESTSYKLKYNGYSPNNCYYSINIYFPDDIFEKKSIETNITKNQIIGSWIVDIKTQKSKRIANWPSDYNFSKWINNEEIELISDSQERASVFEAETGKILSRRVNRLNLKFFEGKDRMVKFTSIKQFENCSFEKETNQRWVQYPFDCLEKSDVKIKISGYPDLLMQYINKDTVKINGKIYTDILEKNRWLEI